MRLDQFLLTGLLIFCLGLMSCSSRAQVASDANSKQDVVNIIALLPIRNSSLDVQVSQMLRAKLNDELRFKGYLTESPDVIDGKLMLLNGGKELGNINAVSSKTIEEILGADAAMYCSLIESKTSAGIFYTPVTVSVRCELRRASSGETIWDAQYKSTGRSFDLIGIRLKMKSQGALEAVLEEVAGKIIETLPYGPQLRG